MISVFDDNGFLRYESNLDREVYDLSYRRVEQDLDKWSPLLRGIWSRTINAMRKQHKFNIEVQQEGVMRRVVFLPVSFRKQKDDTRKT